MALELILLRHGEAEFSIPDTERLLTLKGIEQTREVIRQRAGSLAGLTAAYVSPYRRAQQTFLVIAELAELPLLHQLLGVASHSFDTSTLASLKMPVAAAGCAELDWIDYPR